MENQRLVPRMDCGLMVRLKDQRGETELMTSNVSLHGVHVISDHPPPERQLVQLSFDMGGYGEVSAMGMVAWTKTQDQTESGEMPGFGVKFFAMPSGDSERWTRFVHELKKSTEPGRPRMIPTTPKPAEQPAGEEPPAEKSVADKPPAEKSVAQKPPAETSVAQKPPAETSGAQKPPAETSVADKPPAEKSVAEKPPAEKSVAEKPPAVKKVVERPPAVKKVVERPPDAKKVVERPPDVMPPTAKKVTTKPPAAPGQPALPPAPDKPPPIRRQHQRYISCFMIQIKSQDRLREMYTRDISVGGMFVNTPEPGRVNKTVQLVLVHPASNEKFQLAGEVMRVQQEVPEQERGVALKLSPLPIEREAALLAFIESGVNYLHVEAGHDLSRPAQLQRAIDLVSDSATSLCLLGQTMMKSQDTREAAIAFSRALLMTPEDTGALRGLYEAYLLGGDQQHADEIYDRLQAMKNGDIIV